MDERTSLLWVRRDGTVFRVWITPADTTRSAGGETYSIHFADTEWRQAGSVPVGRRVHLRNLEENDLEGLLEQAIGKR